MTKTEIERIGIGQEWEMDICSKCKQEIEYEDCPDCENGLSHHDCGEDTCCCMMPMNNVTCDSCDGKGYFYYHKCLDEVKK